QPVVAAFGELDVLDPAVVVPPGVAGAAHVGAAAPQVRAGDVRQGQGGAEVPAVVGRQRVGDRQAGEGAHRVQVRPWGQRGVEVRCEDVVDDVAAGQPQRYRVHALPRRRPCGTSLVQTPRVAGE